MLVDAVCGAAGAVVMREEVIGDCRLILGDCRDILPTLGRVDAVVMDPPYGVDGALNSKTARSGNGRKNDYGTFVDSPVYVDTVAVPIVNACIANGWRVVLTPGNRCLTLYPPPDSFGAIMQPASIGLQAWGRADAQPILYYGKSPYGGIRLPGQRCSHTLTETAEPNGHPCPKPEKFWEKIVQSASLPDETILDPFMGSGTTGVACIRLGRRFIGIECEPRYFDIACRRIEAEHRRPRLALPEPVPRATQEALL